MGFTRQELSRDPSRNHADLYALLSRVKHLYGSALRGTIAQSSNVDSPDVVAGATIFDATLSALSRDHSAYGLEGGLPILGEDLFGDDTDAAILPPPMFVAMAYFLDQSRPVSLTYLNVPTGNARFDHALLDWPYTILRDHSAKRRRFYEFFNSYTGTPTDGQPLLSDPRTRAVQLLAVGGYLISHELEKIGEPLIAQIFLPSN
jgi:hypothetical protein